MTLVSVRELGVSERLGLTFADEYPLLPRGKRSKAEGAVVGNCVGLNIRSEILEYVVEGLILGFFKHVQFAALFINNGTWLDLPRPLFHCGLVLGSSDFDI